MTPLREYFHSFGFPAEDVGKVCAAFQQKTVAKGEYLVRAGTVNQSLGFIERGAFQYFYDHDGDELTTYLVGQHGFVAALSSFLLQIPAKENIRALTDAEVWLLPRSRFNELLQDLPRFKDFYIQVLEHQLVCIENSRFDFITMTAEQRYQKLITEEAELLQQIPLQYLASVLGVTPRHLSRIRRKIV